MLTKLQLMDRLEIVDCKALADKTGIDRQKIYRLKTTGNATYETIAELSRYFEKIEGKKNG